MNGVVVTGVGVVSALGLTAGEHFDRLLRGESGVALLDHPDAAELPSLLEARVPPIDVRRTIEQRLLRKILAPSAVFSVLAAGQALADAGIPPGDGRRRDCGLYVGSVQLDVDFNLFAPVMRESLDRQGRFDLRLFVQRGMKVLDPLFMVKALPNSGLCGITIEHQVTGPNINLANGTVSGLQAAALAAAAIRRGDADLALAGGFDSLLHIECMVEHLLAGRVAGQSDPPHRACRPFDLERQGYALGEGAAFVLLESERHAAERGARVYASVLGAAHTYLPPEHAEAGEALPNAARNALAAGGCGPDEVDAVFGDGLALEAEDLQECAAWQALGASRAVFTAATPAVGFTGAASGSLSLVHAAMALERGVIPPLLNCDRPDPRCALPLAHGPVERECRRALVWNSDWRGKRTALLVGRG
ncbi:MAG: beta-ketoacyl synthase N-terminal-like domain-containing protein [Acidobacteriota bacterium]